VSEPDERTAPVREPGPGFSLRAVGRTALTLGAGTAASQVLVFGRELIISSRVGASSTLDALLIALVVPTMLTGFLSHGTATALVPIYLETLGAGGRREARRLAGTVVSWVLLMGAVIGVATLLGSRIVVAISGPGLGEPAQADAVAYLPLLVPMGIVAALAGILTAVCQAEDRFRIIGVGLVLNPAITIATVLIAWPSLGIGSVPVGLLLGAVGTFLWLLLAALRGGFAPLPNVQVTGAVAAFWRHAAPLSLSSMIGQSNRFTDRAVASLTGVGAVSSLRFGQYLMEAPIAAIANAWSMAIYPTLAKATRDERPEAFGEGTTRALTYIVAAFTPLAVGVAALAPIAVDVVYRRGAFGAEAALTTSVVVAALAPMVLVLMARTVVISAHNARARGRLLLANGVMNVTANAVLNLVLGLTFGVVGVALSTTITMSTLLLFLIHRMRRSDPGFDPRAIGVLFVRCLIAALIPAVPIGLYAWTVALQGDTAMSLVTLAGLGLLGVVAYLAVAARIGATEVDALRRAAVQRLGRRRTAA
jgi:putative peptidoglycan lipid II flippase